jgi:hypothetical protein
MSNTYLEIMKYMEEQGLPVTGWKIGKCSYCGNTRFPPDTKVMIHKLPNRLRACMHCYVRRDEQTTSG